MNGTLKPLHNAQETDSDEKKDRRNISPLRSFAMWVRPPAQKPSPGTLKKTWYWFLSFGSFCFGGFVCAYSLHGLFNFPRWWRGFVSGLICGVVICASALWFLGVHYDSL